MLRILSFLLVLCASAFADRPKGFLNINWGASPEEAKRAMQARPGVRFPEDADDYRFTLTGGNFADQPVERWTLEFPDRKFATATVVMKSVGDNQILYKDFCAQLSAKYGTASTRQKLASKTDKKQPTNYQKNTSSLGSITTWKFEPNMKEKSTVVITCELCGLDGGAVNDPTKLHVVVRYTNETLATPPTQGKDSEKPATKGVKKEEL